MTAAADDAGRRSAAVTDHVAGARRIIAENIYCTLATASPEGDPWVSPVFFAFDEEYRIFWVSNRDARHSRLLRANPRVSISIFNSQLPEGDGDGVYCTAEVEELSDAGDLAHAMRVLNARVTKDEFRITAREQVTGDGVWRVYRATPVAFSKLTEGEIVNGQFVDRRIDVDLTSARVAR